MAMVQAELTNTLRKRKDGTINDDPKANEKQILSPTLANFVRNKTKPLKRDEAKEENAPKFISHGKRNFTLERKTHQSKPVVETKIENTPILNVEEKVVEITPNVVEERIEITPKHEKLELLKTIEAPVKCSSVSSIESSLIEHTNDSGFTSHSEDSSLNPSPTPMLNEDQDLKPVQIVEPPTPPLPITEMPKKIERDPDLANLTPIAKQISQIEEANKNVKKFTRQWSKNDSTSKKSDKLLISHGKPNFVVNKQSRPEFVRETTPTSSRKTTSPTSKTPTILSPDVEDELKMCSGAVQQMRKNYNKENEMAKPVKENEIMKPVVVHKSEVKIIPTHNSEHTVTSEVTQQINQLKNVPVNHGDERKLTNQSSVIDSPVLQNGNVESVKHIQISRYMSPNEFKPSKSENGQTPFVPVSADLADKHNFEKKVAVSFAKELSAQPNRYPDMAVVSKPNPNPVEMDRNMFSDIKVDDLLLQNIQFSIDPERNDITIDLKIGVNLRQKMGVEK